MILKDFFSDAIARGNFNQNAIEIDKNHKE